nr:hypothetical protein [uncultured Brevundimonas sp.]
MADNREPYAKLEKLYAEEIARSYQERSTNLRSWIATLSVGNGAGLFGLFAVVQKDKAAELLYLLLPSAWLFVFGLAAASVCAFCQLAFNSKNEEYWRQSDVNRIHDENEWPPHKTEEELSDLDVEGQRWAAASGYAAILSSVAFLVAVGLPLGRITYRAMFSVL